MKIGSARSGSVRSFASSDFGDSHRPALGTEVILFGRNAQKHNLFYVATYNEEFLVPERLRQSGKRGLRHDGDYILEAQGKCEIKAGGELKLAGSTVVLESDSRVEINAPGGLWVNGVQVIVP